MPVVPFAGLSILVHLLVILGHTIARKYLNMPPKRGAKKEARLLALVFGYFIMVAIFLFVFLQASMLVYASMRDDHSTLSYAGMAIEALGDDTPECSKRGLIRVDEPVLLLVDVEPYPALKTWNGFNVVAERPYPRRLP